MRRAHRIPNRTLAFCAAVIVTGAGTACRNGDSTGPGLPNINGTWTLSSVVRNDAFVSCAIAGSVMISQNGQDFSGEVSGSSVVCYISQGDSSLNGNINGSFSNGKLEYDVAMSFSEAGCYFSDGLGGSSVQFGGYLHCNLSDQGDTAAFNGTFTLDRTLSATAERLPIR